MIKTQRPIAHDRRHYGSPIARSPASSSPTQSVASSPSDSQPTELSYIQTIVRAAFHEARPKISYVQRLSDQRQYRLNRVHLEHGAKVLVKTLPKEDGPLSHERHYFANESQTLPLFVDRQLQYVPNLLETCLKGSKHILLKNVDGTPLASLQDTLTSAERKTIDKELGSLTHQLSRYRASQFGSVSSVHGGNGFKTWRRCFMHMMESVLQDAGDYLLNLPYSTIREQTERLSKALSDVQEARLAVVDLGNSTSVLVHTKSHELTSIVDFGSAIYGDVLICRIFENRSDAVTAGFGSDLRDSRSARARILLYNCYRLVIAIIVAATGRKGAEAELKARRELTNLVKIIMTFNPDRP